MQLDAFEAWCIAIGSCSNFEDKAVVKLWVGVFSMMNAPVMGCTDRMASAASHPISLTIEHFPACLFEPWTQASAVLDMEHRLHGRKSEHLVFAVLHRLQATDVLFLFAICRAFCRSFDVTLLAAAQENLEHIVLGLACFFSSFLFQVRTRYSGHISQYFGISKRSIIL
jgi:hypothetical protein